MIDLSIIIVNTNNKKILQECLGSIFKNTHRMSLEVIVTDNNSKDGSQEMIKTLFPKVILIENKENAGFVKASNQGLRIARGRYSCLLNDDTITKDSSFDIMVEFMDKNQKAGACSPKLLNTDGTYQHQGSLFQKKFWESKIPVEIDFAIGACLMLRREVIEKIGLMDENLFFYNDDLDWCKRIKKAGFRIFFIPKAEIVHYGGYSSKRVFNRRLFVEGFRGGLYFTKKHYGNIAYHSYRSLLIFTLILYLPLFVLSFPFKREKFVDRLLAYLDIIKLSVLSEIPAAI
ncbi:glycosyltransferase family 2 protein [Candidatus Saganbacteria bacterium]|nr:glycosyltransferase family 2 protein [Candidatus Saganbacteria bacterium]